MTDLHIIISILSAFTAIGLACAVQIGRHRPPPADPLSNPFDDDLQRIYSREQLETIARRPVQSDLTSGDASRPDASARRFIPSEPAGARASGVQHG